MELDFILLNGTIRVDLKEKIGEGAFGIVRRGVVLGLEDCVAVKIEPFNSKSGTRSLLSESQVLKDLQGIKGVPTFYYYGLKGDYQYLVIQMLGQSLNQKLKECKRHFSLHTTLMLLNQILTIIEAVHKSDYLYRDIKPHNFLISSHSSDLYLIDYGLAKKRSIAQTSCKRLFTTGPSGTLPFISLNSHLGTKETFRDDLESIAYLAIYLQAGKLPWYDNSSVKMTERDVRIAKQQAVETMKSYELEVEFLDLIRHARSLKYNQIPDYCKIRKKFRALADRFQLDYDFLYDWDVLQRRVTIERCPKHRCRNAESEGCNDIRSKSAEIQVVIRKLQRNRSMPRLDKPQKRNSTRKKTLVTQFLGFKSRDRLSVHPLPPLPESPTPSPHPTPSNDLCNLI